MGQGHNETEAYRDTHPLLTHRERERERVRVTAVSSKSDRKEKYLPRAVSCSNGVESKLNEIQVNTGTNTQAVVIIVPWK